MSMLSLPINIIHETTIFGETQKEIFGLVLNEDGTDQLSWTIIMIIHHTKLRPEIDEMQYAFK